MNRLVPKERSVLASSLGEPRSRGSRSLASLDLLNFIRSKAKSVNISRQNSQLSCQRVEEVPRRSFHLSAPERFTEFVFSSLENAFLVLRQIFSSAVDVKVQHRHRRLIKCAFASFAPLGRTFQRQRNAMRIFSFEDIRLKIERVATLCNLSRPAATLGARSGRRSFHSLRRQSATPMRVALTNSSV